MTGGGSDRIETFRRRSRRMRRLVRTAALLTSSLDLGEVLETTLRTASDLMNAEGASVFLLDEETGDLVVHSLHYGPSTKDGEGGGPEEGEDERVRKATEGFRIPAGQGIAGWVAETGRGANIPDAYQDPRFLKEVDRRTGLRTRSYLALPLRMEGRLLGVACVLNRCDGQPFDREDVVVFRHLCNLVAVTLDKARLHRQALEKEIQDRELEAAREIQRAFLPQELPQAEGWRFGALSRMARAVGGDFYDITTCPGGLLALVVGDVSGKGTSAALMGAAVSAEVRRLLQGSCSPTTILEEANRLVRERSIRGMFVTLAVVMLDAETGAGTYASAGHLPLLHYRAEEGVAGFLEGFKGPPAGVLDEADFPDAGLRLAPGDRLALYSDGLVEALAPDSEDQGMEALRRRVEACAGHSATLEDEMVPSEPGGNGEAESWKDDLTYLEIHREPAEGG